MTGMNEVGPWYTAWGMPKGNRARYNFVGMKGAENIMELMYFGDEWREILEYTK